MTAADKETAMVVEDGEEEETYGHVEEMLPNMDLAQYVYLLSVSDNYAKEEKVEAKTKLMEAIKADNMSELYELICSKGYWERDEKLLETMRTANSAKVAEIDAAHASALENAGDVEVLDALLDKAKHYVRIGDKAAAVKAYDVILARSLSTGQRINAQLDLVRLALFSRDMPLLTAHLTKAQTLIDEGGDWDRRNRLKLYRSCYLILSRDFKSAATLLLESVPTFGAVELCSFKDFIFRTVLASVLTQDRVTLKKKVIDSPEVLGVVGAPGQQQQQQQAGAAGKKFALVGGFMNALYDCRYRDFFQGLVELEGAIRRDVYFAPHTSFLLRELRILAYTQFLQAYKSVTLESMAKVFGVSQSFLDNELFHFISSGRLSAKIDKVGGLIETNRPDAKNAQYQSLIKEGDLLLNRIQKLARVVNV